jgi:hypothetical protein
MAREVAGVRREIGRVRKDHDTSGPSLETKDTTARIDEEKRVERRRYCIYSTKLTRTMTLLTISPPKGIFA